MAAICTPTTSVQGRGTIAMTYVRQNSYQVETRYGGTQTNRFDVFRFVATPAAGWQFDHWHISYSYDNGSYFGTPAETHETIYGEDDVYNNPWETVADYTLSVGSWDLIEEYYSTGRYASTEKTLTYDIKAVFSRPATNLLVNSSTVETPAKLVYDPATNKLVADY